jgi:hypothetical protein
VTDGQVLRVLVSAGLLGFSAYSLKSCHDAVNRPQVAVASPMPAPAAPLVPAAAPYDPADPYRDERSAAETRRRVAERKGEAQQALAKLTPPDGARMDFTGAFSHIVSMDFRPERCDRRELNAWLKRHAADAAAAHFMYVECTGEARDGDDEWFWVGTDAADVEAYLASGKERSLEFAPNDASKPPAWWL